MSIEIPGAVPLKFFELAVEKTLALFIVSDRNVHRFPKCFDQKRIEIVRECAEEHKLQWKLINDELIIVIKDLNAFNNNFQLRSNSLSVVAKMMELMNAENNKENSPPSPQQQSPIGASPRDNTQSRSSHNYVLPVPSRFLHRSELPIHKQCENFLNVFINCRVVVVEGSAGCGKTTQIPQFILKHSSESNLECRILVVNPSRICAVNAAERVSAERGETVGLTVGYQIKLESKTSPSSNLIYTSADYLLDKFLRESPNDFFQNFTTLIIDEVQERDILIDFLMLCVRELVDTKKLKIVVITSVAKTSAEIAAYFDRCEIFKIPMNERTEPIEKYLEDILKIENIHFTRDQLDEMQTSLVKSSSSATEQSTTYDQKLVGTYNQMVGNVLDLDLIANLAKHHYYNTEKSSSILIFLPGYNEITLLFNKLVNVLNCEIISIHNQMQSTDESKIFKNMRKIILTTNLAESMLTIDDVECVIDTGKERFETFDAENNVSSSCVNWISKRSAIQRGTRVTIPNQGIIYRLYSKDSFESFDDETEPAILHSDISKICLMSQSIAKNESIEDFLFKAISPPTSQSVICHIKLLQRVGALYPDGSITQLGNCLVEIPLPIQYAKMVIYGIFFRCIDPILTIASILLVGSPFMIDENNKNGIAEVKKKLQQGSFSDIFVMLRAFQKWNEYETSNNKFDSIFCEQYFVGSGTLQMIALNRVRLVGHLRSTKMLHSVGNIASLNEHSNNWSVIKACIAAGCYPNIANMHGELITVKDEKVDFHPETALLTTDFNSSLINWVIFVKKFQNSTEKLTIENCTIVSDFCLALVAGSAIDLRIETTSVDAHSICYNIRVDDSIQLTGSEVTAKALKFLRDQLNQVFDKFLLDVGKFQLNDANDFTVHEGIVLLLKLEDDALGLKTGYEGIGSRPRIVTREFDTTVSSYGNSTMNSLNTSSSSVASVSRSMSKLRF